MTLIAPSTTAATTAGSMNCQTLTPTARATISSLLRVRRQNAMMPLNRIANGVSASAVCGSLKSAISRMVPRATSGFEAARRSSSSVSAT